MCGVAGTAGWAVSRTRAVNGVWRRKPAVGQRIRARGWLLRLSFSLIGVSLIYRSDGRRAMKPVHSRFMKFLYESMGKIFRSDVQGYP